MDVTSLLAQGLGSALQPACLFAMIAGLVWGIVGGALPGVSGSVACALVLPLTWGMDTAAALTMLGGVWAGANYGGSIPAILINTPGAPSCAATTIDGYQLAKKGQAGKALGVSLVSGVIGGFTSAVLLIPAVLLLGTITLAFSSPEYCALAVFGLMVISSLESRSMLKGITSGILGLLITTIGFDPMSGVERFTFGMTGLVDGLDLVVVLVGLFAVGEALFQIAPHPEEVRELIDRKAYTALPSIAELLSVWRAIAVGLVVGLIVGVMPGAGATVSAFVARNEVKRFSKHPELLGKGSIEGVAAPETANNAVQGGDLVPTLALGIPGSNAAAIMLAALIMHGVTPGPFLLTSQPQLVFTLFVTLVLVNLLMLPVGYGILQLAMRAMMLPEKYILTAVFCLVVASGYALNNSIFDVFAILAFGLLGYVMRLTGFSAAATVLGVILGYLIENEMRRSLVMSLGSWSIFVTRPIAMVMLCLAAATLLYPALASLVGRMRRRERGATQLP